MSNNNDTIENLTTKNVTEQRILLSLIGPKTARELSIQLDMNMRKVQRYLKDLKNRGKIREMRKAERRKLDWAPDPKAYPAQHWKEHRTDLRIPVYILESDPTEVRKKIDELLGEKDYSVNLQTCLFLLDLLNGKYENYNPQYSDLDKLSKMIDLFQRCQIFTNEYIVQNSVHISATLFDRFISEIISLCDRLRESNLASEYEEKISTITGKLNDKVDTQFVGLFISDALASKTCEDIEGRLKKSLVSLEDIKDESELKKAIDTLHRLILMGGFPNHRKTIRETILEVAMDLSNRGVNNSLIDELLNIRL